MRRILLKLVLSRAIPFAQEVLALIRMTLKGDDDAADELARLIRAWDRMHPRWPKKSVRLAVRGRRARDLYPAVHPVVRAVKFHFRKIQRDHGKITNADLGAYGAEHPEALTAFTKLKAAWTLNSIKDLLNSQPSSFTHDLIGALFGRHERTAKSLIYGGKHKAKVTGKP